MKAIPIALAALLLSAAPAVAQDFPYDTFPATTLAAIHAEMGVGAAEGAALSRKDGKPVVAYDVRTPKARVRAVFTGQKRAIPAPRMRLIATHFRTLGREDAGDLYQNEYAVEAGGASYWLPMQKVLEPFLADEVKPGQAIDLYLLRLGSVSVGGQTDIVLMVEEFAVGAVGAAK